MRKVKLFSALALCVLAFVLASCSAANYEKGEENMSLTRAFGDTVQVEYSYRMLLYDWGPYQLEITPMGLVTLEHNGKTKECVECRAAICS